MTPHRRLDLQSRWIEGELVIWDKAAGAIHRLNQTASFVWEQCDGATTPAEIAERIAAEFDDAPPDVLNHVLAALADLRERSLLQ